MLSCICMLTWKSITVMALVGFSASAVQALTYQNGDYMGSLNKKASGAQCFIMALGLFWDIVTGLPWTPNGVSSLGPRGYCIFLPGAHYLTINSPYGADSSLNKLLLLLLGIISMNSSFCETIRYSWIADYIESNPSSREKEERDSEHRMTTEYHVNPEYCMNTGVDPEYLVKNLFSVQN